LHSTLKMCKPTLFSEVARESLEGLGPALKPEDLDRDSTNISGLTINPLDKQLTHLGAVRKIMIEKQYGFIRTEDGSDLFFMLNDVCEPWVVAVGDQVTYHVNEDNSHTGKSRAIRILPSHLARPSCHSPGGSVLRQTNALRSSMVRMTVSAKPPAPVKTAEEWNAEIDAATNKFRTYLIEFAGMDDDEAVEFGDKKIEKAMKSDNLSSLPKHLQQIVHAKFGLAECTKVSEFNNSLRLSECSEDSEEGHCPPSSTTTTATEARAVIASARMAKANRFREGEEHAGEVAQIVRDKYGFIVAETTSASKRVLKQKLFFHLKDVPEGTSVGDRVTFLVHADPYNNEKMIAKNVTVTKKAPSRSKNLTKNNESFHNKQGSNGNRARRYGQGNGNNGPLHRASLDGNWRRGGFVNQSNKSDTNTNRRW